MGKNYAHEKVLGVHYDSPWSENETTIILMVSIWPHQSPTVFYAQYLGRRKCSRICVFTEILVLNLSLASFLNGEDKAGFA